MTTTTIDPILTPDEHRRLHAAFDAILADAPCCPNCGRPERSAITGETSSPDVARRDLRLEGF